MKYRLFIHIVILLSVLIFTSYAAEGAIQWESNFETALSKAKEKGFPIMIDFSTGWCHWCTKLDKETFHDPGIEKTASKFISLKLDGDKERNLVSKYRVQGYPTVVFLDSTGKEVTRAVGFRDADAMSEIMIKVLKANPPRPKGGNAQGGNAARETGPSNIQLSGIMYNETDPKAIINNKIVGVGDVVEGAKILEITSEYVKFRENGREFHIDLKGRRY